MQRLLTIEEVARVLRLGKTKVYELITKGELEAVHIGRACRVPAEAVGAYVDQLRESERVESNPSSTSDSRA